ncbi:putative disease resistance RPP13-like protein 1 [Musa acuminata AAA Group]|uniref:putative disease resistance RPP13-like protein 1 n=1 Tax=Musa acuminata AAA Group TaxID=214697 RepID=UPI0031D775D1
MSSWILAGLGSLGEAFIGSLIEKISDDTIPRLSEVFGVGAKPGDGTDLLKLKTTLTGTKHIIGRVENMWIKDEDTKKQLKELVMELKDTAYDAEDLLDEIQFRVLNKQMEQQGAQGDEASNQSSSSSSGLFPWKKMKISVPKFTSRFFGREDDVKRVRENQMKLDKITTCIEDLITTLDADERQMITSVVPRTTTSFPLETQVFGREEQLNQLLGLLVQSADGSGSSDSGISTLTIVGIGGVGKTTLAQQAYNHESVKDYFQHEVWVCVSYNFNVERLTKEIIESITENKCDLSNLDTLQVVLKKNLTSKRFLLVLDDVWNEDSLKWERFCAPLRYGEPGSKILVTTRSKKIAEMVGNPIPLGGLDEASYWKLFKKCAFGSEDAGEFPQLEAIAKKIAGRLKGLPLAARTVGGLLKVQMNEKHWRNIAGSEIWQLPQDEEGVLPVLQLSYRCLPTHLKRCFVFCSLFPEDCRFYEPDLIRLWMAEGYVAQDNMTLEAVGSGYFRELVNRSFFQEAHWGSAYVMHDLIHDLAQFISEGEFCRIDDDESKEIPNTIRHLSATLTDKTKLIEFSCYEKLRTLMINYKSHWYGIGVEGSLFLRFERLKNIRVLILQRCGLRELPETIGGSIHLRYLDISHNFYFRRLPESLCGLYNLRVLDLWGCELQSFPHGMSKLINLMHLNAEDKIISEINDVGKLTSLQGLCSFKVLKDQGHEVAQLGGLKQLHGQLRITNLENVESKQKAGMANLNNKQYLDELVLEWTSDDGSSLDGNELVVSEEVLEGLQPHQALKRLTIRGYIGVRSPSWLQTQLLANLITLDLYNCKAWEDISCIGQLQNLKKLYVKGMPAVKQISHGLSTESKFLPNLEELVLENMVALEELPSLGLLPCLKVLRIDQMSTMTKVGHGFFGYRDQGKCFPCLEELRFSGMPKWEEWSWAEGRELFPCLRKLEIIWCPRLKRMPPLPPSLKSLSLCEVGTIEVPRLWAEIDGSSSSMTVSELKLYSLEKVVLEDIPECEGLPCLGQLPSLKVLRIERMPAVKMVGDGFFGSRDESKCFPSLEELTFRDMPQWEEWSWADGRKLFPCLRKLEIERCPRLKRMPPLPTSVESLSLCQVGLTEVPRLWEEIDGSSSGMTVSELKIYSLEEIKLEDIPECEELPCIGQLPSLKVLRIQRMPAVKKVGYGFFGSRDESKCFPSLEELTFRDMPQWEEWSWADGRQLFPCLRNLDIVRCPRLKRMPPLPPSVESLSLCQVGFTEVARLWEEIDGSSNSMTVSELKIYSHEEIKLEDIPECEELPCLGQLPSLEVLRIERMTAMKKVGDGFFGSRDQGKCFPSLEELTFRDMPQWEEWSWADGRQLFPCLRKLQIERCPRLKRMPPLPPSVKSLSLCQVGLTEVPRLWEEIDESSSSMTVSELKIYSLEEIKLEDIPECERLPCLGQLPSLKVLRIQRMPAVKKVGDGFFGSRDHGKCFPSLEVLTFINMPEWEEWSWADGRQLFPRLRNLEIKRCPRLKRLPPLPPSLETLEIDEVGLTELPGLWEGIHGGGSCITASLSTLRIRKCPNLRNLEEGLLSHSLPNIRYIEIAECAELKWQPVKGFKELTSLAALSICSCPNLMGMTRDWAIDILLPPSIEELVLSDCGNLGKLLPGCLHNLTSLTRLEIGDCPSIESLPETSLLHLKRLQSLSIWHCDELRSIDGLRVLESLRELTIKLCPKLLLNEGNEQVEGSSVTELYIDDTALFKLSLLRRTLPSVHALTISNFPRATMSDEEEQLLRSLAALKWLEFEDCKNLQSLPRELHVLPSLRLLAIIGCPEIQALPEKGLPTSLSNLHFEDCHPRLTEQLQKHLAEIKSSGRLAIREDTWSSLGYGFKKLARWKLRQTALHF